MLIGRGERAFFKQRQPVKRPHFNECANEEGCCLKHSMSMNTFPVLVNRPFLSIRRVAQWASCPCLPLRSSKENSRRVRTICTTKVGSKVKPSNSFQRASTKGDQRAANTPEHIGQCYDELEHDGPNTGYSIKPPLRCPSKPRSCGECQLPLRSCWASSTSLLTASYFLVNVYHFLSRPRCNCSGFRG